MSNNNNTTPDNNNTTPDTKKKDNKKFDLGVLGLVFNIIVAIILGVLNFMFMSSAGFIMKLIVACIAGLLWLTRTFTAVPTLKLVGTFIPPILILVQKLDKNTDGKIDETAQFVLHVMYFIVLIPLPCLIGGFPPFCLSLVVELVTKMIGQRGGWWIAWAILWLLASNAMLLVHLRFVNGGGGKKNKSQVLAWGIAAIQGIIAFFFYEGFDATHDILLFAIVYQMAFFMGVSTFLNRLLGNRKGKGKGQPTSPNPANTPVV